MFFSLLKWWMLKKTVEDRKHGQSPAPGKFGQHPTQGWSSELTGLLAEQRESGQVPKFNAGNANSSNNGTYTRGARLTLIQVPNVPSSIWVMSFSNIMKLCVYIYIYIRLNIHQSFCCRMEFSMHSSYHQSSASSETCGFKASKLH